ncbi:MAG: MBL fold metallo-hydrolase [Gemmatimonadota bacterium]|nr:MAG: MBL fold metallo-hydrolase [Gemmatimonadota bacterium]
MTTRVPRLLLAVVMIGALTAPLAAQRDFSGVQIQTERLTEGLFVLMGSGGNIGLSIGEDGPFVIDDQFAPLTEKIKMAIAELTDRDVRWVLNTHWHGDHTGGNENFGEGGAFIVAHDNVFKRLNPAEFRDLVGERSAQMPEAGMPVVTFDRTMTFHWNGEDIRIFHVAHAHTDGDAVVHFQKGDAVHMGDTFFNGFYPFIDVDSGGNVNGMIRSAEAVLAFATSNTKIIPGHGPVTDVIGLRSYRTMLMTVRDRVLTMVNDGASQQEVVASNPTADFDEAWASRGDQWTGRFVVSVYRSLTEGH